MDLEGSALLASLIVSSIGLVVLGYGKRLQRLPHVVVGLVLIAFPYVVPSAPLIAAIAAVLLGGLWLATRLGL